ncbi:membrane protein [Thermobispora bispora]
MAEARQEAGLTVAQLSERTRIREAIIEGIERDDFSSCGGDFYARGHIRAIASALGLDPEAMVRQYEAETRGSYQPVRAAEVFKADRLLSGGMRRSGWTAVIAVAAALVAVFALTRLFGGSAEETVKQAPAAGQVQNAVSKPERAAPAAPAAPERVTVKISTVRPAWLNVQDAKGKELFEGVLPGGKTSTWTSKSRLRITFGDAGAVKVEVNGQQLGSPGRDGQMVRRTYGPQSPAPR